MLLGSDLLSLEGLVGGYLKQSGLTLAVAESCTGGLIGHRLTDVPGASDYFLGGVVSYSNDAKHDLLGVSAEVLARHGAVSPETARDMARGVRAVFRADLGLAVTPASPAPPAAVPTSLWAPCTSAWPPPRGKTSGAINFTVTGRRSGPSPPKPPWTGCAGN